MGQIDGGKWNSQANATMDTEREQEGTTAEGECPGMERLLRSGHGAISVNASAKKI